MAQDKPNVPASDNEKAKLHNSRLAAYDPDATQPKLPAIKVPHSAKPDGTASQASPASETVPSGPGTMPSPDVSPPPKTASQSMPPVLGPTSASAAPESLPTSRLAPLDAPPPMPMMPPRVSGPISASAAPLPSSASRPVPPQAARPMPMPPRVSGPTSATSAPLQPPASRPVPLEPTRVKQAGEWSHPHLPDLPVTPSIANPEVLARGGTWTGAPTPSSSVPGSFRSVRRAIGVGLARLQEPQPEELEAHGFLPIVKPTTTLGLFPVLILTNAIGLLLISVSYYLGLMGVYDLEFSFILGLLLIFVPNLLRLLSSIPSRFERMYVLCGLGLTFYLISLMMSPQEISSFDAFLHWITADNILRTGHLFSNNALHPVNPYYPGIEIVTNAISSLTGLNTFYADIPLIATLRVLTVLALFLFYEKITNSSRMAGIAAAIYMVNPHFIFFDAMYSYETIALPFVIFTLYILARYENVGGKRRWIIFTSWIVLFALTFSHYTTGYIFDGLLLLWALVSFFTANPRKGSVHLLTLAIFGILLAVVYASLMQGNPLWSYLASYFKMVLTKPGQLMAGTNVSLPLSTSTAAPSPIWDQILMLGSVALVAFSLPFGLLTIWRLHRRDALPMMLGIFALAYPITQALRFSTSGSEIADRSAAFLFLAVAYVMTVLITHFWPIRRLNKGAIALITCVISVMLVGGIIFEAGPGFINLPGPANEAGTNQIQTPTNPSALSTFNPIPQVNRLFDNGNILIYDTGAFIHGTASE